MVVIAANCPVRRLYFLAGLGERKLFTPGPLGISKTTKEAMLRDAGSRETEFVNLVKNIRERLVKMAGMYVVSEDCIKQEKHWRIQNSP